MDTSRPMADLTVDQLDAIEARYREWSPDWRELAPDAAALVDEVRRLREEVRRLEAVASDLTTENLRLDRDRAHAEAERDRLRDGIREVIGYGVAFDAKGTHSKRVVQRLQELIDGQEDHRDPDDGMTDDEAADAFLAALDNSCPLCGGGPVVDGVCRDDHHHDDQEDGRG